MSVTSCVDVYKTIDNIEKLSEQFEYSFIINDEHDREDQEFKLVPPHFIRGTEDTYRLFNAEERLKSRIKYFFKKTKFSGLSSEHNKTIILNAGFEEICICGFTASMDIVPTVLDFIYNNKIVSIASKCISDTTRENKERSLGYLNWIGIKEYG
jgi:nicotinamidase-related amidase